MYVYGDLWGGVINSSGIVITGWCKTHSTLQCFKGHVQKSMFSEKCFFFHFRGRGKLGEQHLLPLAVSHLKMTYMSFFYIFFQEFQ